MVSKIIGRILVLFLCVLTLGGIGVAAWTLAGQDKLTDDKTVIINDKTYTEMDVELNGIVPGDKITNSFTLKANKGDSYFTTIEFKKDGSDSLAKFIDVDVFVNKERLSSAKLKEHIDGKKISFEADFSESEELEIEIVYSMGIDVGDEAQSTTADIKLILTSKE